MAVDFKEYSRRMEKALDHLQEEFGAVRAGRANAIITEATPGVWAVLQVVTILMRIWHTHGLWAIRNRCGRQHLRIICMPYCIHRIPVKRICPISEHTESGRVIQAAGVSGLRRIKIHFYVIGI